MKTESTAQSEQLDAAPSAPIATTESLVDAWFSKHFHNMGALFDERSYAHLYAAKEDLKTVLAPLRP